MPRRIIEAMENVSLGPFRWRRLCFGGCRSCPPRVVSPTHRAKTEERAIKTVRRVVRKKLEEGNTGAGAGDVAVRVGDILR